MRMTYDFPPIWLLVYFTILVFWSVCVTPLAVLFWWKRRKMTEKIEDQIVSKVKEELPALINDASAGFEKKIPEIMAKMPEYVAEAMTSDKFQESVSKGFNIGIKRIEGAIYQKYGLDKNYDEKANELIEKGMAALSGDGGKDAPEFEQIMNIMPQAKQLGAMADDFSNLIDPENGEFDMDQLKATILKNLLRTVGPQLMNWGMGKIQAQIGGGQPGVQSGRVQMPALPQSIAPRQGNGWNPGGW